MDGEASSREPGKPMTAGEAAAELGVSVGRVYALIRAGRLRADRFGATWMIARADLDAVRDRRPGRPRNDA